jgi:hypothetical protein
MALGCRLPPGRSGLHRILPATIAVVALLAVSCGGGQPTPTAEGDPTPAGDAPEATTPTAPSQLERDDEPAEIPEELRFRAPLLAGGTFRGAEYAGRDVAVWFWAPW